MLNGLQIEKSSKSSSAIEGDLCVGAGSSYSGSTAFLFLTARRLFTGLAALVGWAPGLGLVALLEEEEMFEEK